MCTAQRLNFLSVYVMHFLERKSQLSRVVWLSLKSGEIETRLCPTHRFPSVTDKSINSLGDSVLLNDDPKGSGAFQEDFSWSGQL